jgi:hypothetical protein
MRSANSPPWLLLPPLHRSLPAASDPYRLVAALTIPLSLLTVALQFSSTILLSDLQPGLITGNQQSVVLAADFQYNCVSLDVNTYFNTILDVSCNTIATS